MNFLPRFSGSFLPVLILIFSGFLPVLASTGADTLMLKGGWNVVDGENSFPASMPYLPASEGSVTLETTFNTPDLTGRVVYFECEGINFLSHIYLNDQLVGLHPGGYLPVRLPVPVEFFNGPVSHLRIQLEAEPQYKGTIPLAIRPGDPVPRPGVLSVPQIVLHYSTGFENKTYSYSLSGKTVSFSPGLRLRIATTFKKVAGSNYSLRFTLTDTSMAAPLYDETVAVAMEQGKLTDIRFPEKSFSAPLWSPASPNLLKSVTRFYMNDSLVLADEQAIGFRQIGFTSSSMIINSDTLVMKGFEYNYTPLNPAHSHQARQDLLTMREAGANVVSFRGIIPGKDLLQFCDSIGLIIQTRIPGGLIPPDLLSDGQFRLTLESQADKQLQLSEGHPSAALFSPGGPFSDGTDWGYLNSWMADLKTKYTSVQLVIAVSDEAAAAQVQTADLIGLEWANIPLNEIKTRIRDWKSGKPAFVNGLGVEINPANHNGFSDPMSLQHQAKYLMDTWPLITGSSSLTGAIIRSFNDLQTGSPRMVSGYLNSEMVTTGLLNTDGTARPAFDYIKSLFAGEAVFNPSVGRSETGIEVVFPVSGVIIIFFFSFFYSSNRRFKDNLSRSFIRSYNFFSDVREQRVMLGFQSYGLLLLIVLTLSTLLVSVLYSFRESGAADYLLSILFPWESVRSLLISMTWNPVGGIAGLSLFILLALFAGIVFSVLFYWIIRIRVGFSQMLISMTWSSTPILLLLPFAMVFEQIVSAGSLWMILSVSLIGIIFFNLFMRILKGLSILLIIPSGKVYFTGFFLVFLFLALTGFHYEYHYQVSSYWNLWLQTAWW